jgi:hypothetical protein
MRHCLFMKNWTKDLLALKIINGELSMFRKIVLLLSVISLAACSTPNKPGVIAGASPVAPGKTLYHDDASGLDYDYKAVCGFRSTLNTLLTGQEWDAVHHGKYGKQVPVDDPGGQFVMYMYAHKGAEIDYSNSSRFEVWRMSFNAKRLPKAMRSRKYFLSRFDIHNAPASSKTLSLGCDAEKITVNFKNDKVINVTLQMLLGAI